MTLKMRAKKYFSSKFLKRYAVIFAFGAVLMFLAAVISVYATSGHAFMTIFDIFLVSVFLFPVIYAMFCELYTNFVLNNHRLTTLYFAVILAVLFSFICVIPIGYVFEGVEALSCCIAIPLYPFLVSLVLLLVNLQIGRQFSLCPLAVMTASLGTFFYLLLASVSNGGFIVCLPILLVPASVAIIMIALQFTVLKKKRVVVASVEEMTADYNKYLDKVFSKMPADDKYIELREQLFSILTDETERLIPRGMTKYQIYDVAVDALGDYHETIDKDRIGLIKKYTDINDKLFLTIWYCFEIFFFFFPFEMTTRPFKRYGDEITQMCISLVALVAFGVALGIGVAIKRIRTKRRSNNG